MVQYYWALMCWVTLTEAPLDGRGGAVVCKQTTLVGWGFSKGEGFVALPARQAYSGLKVAAEIGWGNGGIEINASPTGSGHF